MALSRARKDLARVKNILVDDGYSGKKFVDAVKEPMGANVEVAKRSELHSFCGDAQAVGRGTLVRLAREVPQTLEELRRQTPHKPTVHGPGLPRDHPQKILNGF
jgi:transposase